MTRKMTLAAFLVVLPLACSSCGGGGGGSGLSLDTLATEMATVYCTKAYECCDAAEIAALQTDGTFTDKATCITKYTSSFGGLVSLLTASIDAGRGAYDGGKAQTCLDTYKNVGCQNVTDPSTLLDNCANPWTGKQSVDQPCNNYLDCATGLVCFGPQGTQTCKALLTVDTACAAGTTVSCAAGLFCDSATDKCTAQRDVDGACADHGDCKTGLYCNGIKCVSKKADGIACETGEDSNACQAGLFCVGTAPGVCGKVCDGQ